MVIHQCLCCFLLLVAACCHAYQLKQGEVKYKLVKLADDKYVYDVTDGRSLFHGVTSVSHGPLSCTVAYDPSAVSELLADDTVPSENIGESEIKALLERCKESSGTVAPRVQSPPLQRSIDDNTSGIKKEPKPTIDPFNKKIVIGKPFPGDFGTGKPSGAGSHFAIFPGTKWCGFQNVANNINDLGKYNKTDSCCRTHDHCPYYIDRFETKFHYYNAKPWTVSHCECDQHLFDCLKSVKTDPSNEVGNLFFGVLDVQCFTFEVGQYCAEKHWSKLWCTKKATGPMAVMQNFPHKWGDKDGSPKIVGRRNEMKPNNIL